MTKKSSRTRAIQTTLARLGMQASPEKVVAAGIHGSDLQRQITNRYGVCVVWTRLLEPHARPADVEVTVAVAGVRVAEVVLLLEKQALVHQQLPHVILLLPALPVDANFL